MYTLAIHNSQLTRQFGLSIDDVETESFISVKFPFVSQIESFNIISSPQYDCVSWHQLAFKSADSNYSRYDNRYQVIRTDLLSIW